MSDLPDDFDWGQTGKILKRLDLQEREKREEYEARAADSLPMEAGGKTPAESPPAAGGKAASALKLAIRYHTQKKYEQAERLYQEALISMGESQGIRTPEFAQLLNNIGRLYFDQERFQEAEPLYQRSLAIVQDHFGEDHPEAARRFANLAELYLAMGKEEASISSYQQAIAIIEKRFGPMDPTTVKSLKAYANLLRKWNRSADAKAVESRIHILRIKQERRRDKDRRGQQSSEGMQGSSRMPNRRKLAERRHNTQERRTPPDLEE